MWPITYSWSSLHWWINKEKTIIQPANTPNMGKGRKMQKGTKAEGGGLMKKNQSTTNCSTQCSLKLPQLTSQGPACTGISVDTQETTHSWQNQYTYISTWSAKAHNATKYAATAYPDDRWLAVLQYTWPRHEPDYKISKCMWQFTWYTAGKEKVACSHCFKAKTISLRSLSSISLYTGPTGTDLEVETQNWRLILRAAPLNQTL